MQIGYIGLGSMGGALARRIVANHPLVVLDLNPAAVTDMVKLGATAASSAADLARRCDAIVLCLPRSSDVRRAIFGPGGLAEGLSAGKLVIDQTSGIPGETKEMAEELAKLGVAMVDAPVAGGIRGAENGTIAMMLSGPAGAYERAAEVLRLIGPNVLNSGARVGDGQAMKLINNAMNANLRLATYEIVAVGRKMGLTMETLIGILNKGSGRNFITQAQLADILNNTPSTIFSLALMLKDVTEALNLAMKVGMPMPIASVARGLLQIGCNTIGPNAMLSDVIGLVERMADGKLGRTDADEQPKAGVAPSKTGELKVGYVGLGVMGGALTRRLMLSRKMHVFDAKPGVAESFAADGAIAVPDLPTMARDCDVIIVCVPTSHDVRQAVFGKGGLAEGLSPGKIIVDQTTGEPSITREIAADLEKLGVALVDAPVSGGPRGAVAGTIAIMCGGPQAEFETVRPILAEISPNYVYCGKTGNGHVAKLINNAVASCNRLVTYEGASLGVKYGLTLANMAVVLNKGSGSSDGSARILPVLSAGGKSADFRIALMVKDLRLAAQMGFACGGPMMIGAAVRSLFEAGVGRLGGDANLDDMAGLFESFGGFSFAGA